MAADVGELGELVPAATVARVLGLHQRTIRRWIASGELRGKHKRGRWYAYRSAFEALRDRPQGSYVSGSHVTPGGSDV